MTIPAWWLLAGGCPIVVVILVLVLWRRREKRRQMTLEIYMQLAKMGFPDKISGFWQAYTIGNYLGRGSIGERFMRAIDVFLTKEKIMMEFRDMFFVLLNYYKQNPEDLVKIRESLDKPNVPAPAPPAP